MKKNNLKKVVGFVGLPGSGKSTAIEKLQDLAIIVTMGDVIRQEVRNRGLVETPITLGNTAKSLRKTFGNNVIAERCVDSIYSLTENIIVVDGLRSMDEVKVFRKHWKFPIIAILCDDEVRYTRLKNRGRNDDSLDLNLIKQRDKREIGFGLKEVLHNADYKIENVDNIDSLQKQVLDIFETVIREY